MSDEIHGYTRRQGVEDKTLITLEEFLGGTRVMNALLSELGRQRDFQLGDVFIRANAAEILDATVVLACLIRHQFEDWGEVDELLKQENGHSRLYAGRRVLSAYRDKLGRKFWIITEDNGVSTRVTIEDEF